MTEPPHHEDDEREFGVGEAAKIAVVVTFRVTVTTVTPRERPDASRGFPRPAAGER